MIGCLSLAELCASTGVSPKRMQVFLTDFERAGIVEREGERWRLTKAAVEEYGFAFRAIRAGNVPLAPGDDDGLAHCKPGPAKAAA